MRFQDRACSRHTVLQRSISEVLGTLLLCSCHDDCDVLRWAAHAANRCWLDSLCCLALRLAFSTGKIYTKHVRNHEPTSSSPEDPLLSMCYCSSLPLLPPLHSSARRCTPPGLSKIAAQPPRVGGVDSERHTEEADAEPETRTYSNAQLTSRWISRSTPPFHSRPGRCTLPSSRYHRTTTQ